MKGTKWMALLCASVMACSMSVSAAPFDAAYYAQQNPDVAAAVGNDAAALELHYQMFGAAEGRAGNAEDAAAGKSKTGIGSFEEFDAEYYALQNPDVAAIYGADALSLYTHYVNFGAAEGRASSAVAKEKSESDKKSSESGEKSKSENPYARFASSNTTSKRKSSKKSSSKSESSSESAEESSTPQVKHTLSYKDNDDGTHDITCSVTDCTEHNKTNVACSDFEYSIGDNGFGNHDKICKDCGYKKQESCTITYPVQDEHSHRQYCELCGHGGWSSHSWNNGECDVCHYVCQHDWVDGSCSYRCGASCPNHGDNDGDDKCDECGGSMNP